MFAEVIVDIANSEVDKIFEYSFTDSSIVSGSRVVVPFGKFTTYGIVMKVKTVSEYPPEKIKPIIRVLEDIPCLTEECLRLADYIVKTCYVSKATALRLFLPSEMRKGKVKEQFRKFVSLTDGIDINSVLSGLKSTAVRQKEIIEFLTENGKTPLTFANERFGNSAVKSLQNKGIIKTENEKYFRSPYKDLYFNKKEITLTDNQKRAIESIESTDKRVSLIHGVTGSGKTEIYFELIDRAIKKGKTAIMLVPEISLTPQMLRGLRARFGDNAAILHSGLSAGEKFDEWWRLRSGDAKIAIGARSAIFAPLTDVGIIIIDEEHDGSYLSESAPRYQTVDEAVFRANFNNAKLVLGSATPSVDTYKKAKDGEYNLITLKDRINKKPLPDIEVVDMRNEVRRGNNSPFSGALKYELEKCLNEKNQAIIFLNQRGYSKTVVCTECGHVFKCDACDVSLTYHKEDESLLCHYCGAKYKMVKACTECGSVHLKYGGYGTEKVVYELQKLFKNARILRMDRDTTQTKEGHAKILGEFAERKADILVGTQMIAKGHDFPFVTLVGILDADMSLHFSDFRSGERTYQLITQVAGRCGRAENTGKVVLQTYSVGHPVLMRAINYDYEGLFEHEISVRKATGFPPYSYIGRVLIQGGNEETVISATKSLYGELEELHKKERDAFRFFGCMKAPLKKLQGKYRYQILMRIDENRRDILDTVFAVSDKYNNHAVTVYLEVNPNNLT